MTDIRHTLMARHTGLAGTASAGVLALLMIGAPAQAWAQDKPPAPTPPSQQPVLPGGSVTFQTGEGLTPPPTVYDAGKPHPAAAPTKAAPENDPGTPSQGGKDTHPDDIVVTGRFIDSGASSATKLDIRVLDTPASVASYNGKFLKAIETTNVSDLYRYMTGIQRAGNTGYDISFRGFKTSGNDRNAIVTDGLPGLSVRFGSPPTIGVDHIELVKGPTSVLYGQGQPGGFINIITKKPKSVPHAEVELKGLAGAGPFDRTRGGLVSLDVTGPILMSDGAITARAVAEGGERRGFRDFSYERPIFFAPSVAFKPLASTTITLSGEYRYVKTHYDTFLVAPNRDVSKIASINTTYQERDDYLIERGVTGNIFLAQKFTSWLRFNAGYRYVDHTDEQNNFDVVGFRDAANTIVTRRARAQNNRRTYSFGDANFTASINTFGIKHTAIVGTTAGQETASLNRLRFYNGTATDGTDVALYNPVHGLVASPEAFPLFNTGQSANLNWRYTTQTSFGIYGSDLISIGQYLKLLVGGRYANERQTITDLRITTFVPVYKKDTKVLPQAGLLIQPTRNLTFYASYSTSFVPVAAASQDVFGLNPFVPTLAKSKEGGIKTNLFHNRLNLTAAYFDIERGNVINTFTCPTAVAFAAGIANGTLVAPANAPRTTSGALIPASGTCSNQLGGDRSRGFEVEVNATPFAGLTITSGYAHTKARITTGSTAGFVQNNARVANAPDDAFNFWTRYDFQNKALSRFGIGLGVSYIGERAGLLPTTLNDTRPQGGTLPLPSYTTVDAGLYVKATDAINVTLLVNNLFDRRYIESAGFSGDIQLVPGTPRLLTLTARVGF